jgi:hypothetical protein
MKTRRSGLLAALTALALIAVTLAGPAAAQPREGHFSNRRACVRSVPWSDLGRFCRRAPKTWLCRGPEHNLGGTGGRESGGAFACPRRRVGRPESGRDLYIGPPPIRALKKLGTSIPVVFAGIGDPVRLGVVESIPRPGGNFTGFSNRGDELVAKRLQLLKELVPDIIRIAMFQNPLNPSVAITVEEVTKNSKTLGWRCSQSKLSVAKTYRQQLIKRCRPVSRR